MKKFYFFNIYLFFASFVWSQSTNQLTQEQMYEDFDYLQETLQKVSPRFEVRKLVTGCDVIADIQELRAAIDTIPSEGDFYKLLKQALWLCKDMHISLSSYYPYDDLDSAVIARCKERLNYLQQYDIPFNTLDLIYVNGEYYVPDILNEDTVLQIPAQSKLVEINGTPIDEYITNWVIPHTSRVLWDSENKKYYVIHLITPQSLNLSADFVVKFLYEGEVKEVNLSSFSHADSPKTKNHPDCMVEYFAEDQIMYIRLPSMRTSKIPFYTNEIGKYKETDIKKIIIDVRGNGGGDDRVWSEILSAIIKEPAEVVQKLAFKDNELMKYCLQRSNIQFSDTIPLVIEKDSLFYRTRNRTISPSENSLNYTGKIYVLTDEYCFSSTLAFIAFAQGVDQLVTVGTPLGYFGGQGVNPFFFMIPHSNLFFSIDGSLDISRTVPGDLDTYFNNKLDIVFYPTIEDIIHVRKYEGEFYGKNLYQHDPLFNKILKLP